MKTTFSPVEAFTISLVKDSLDTALLHNSAAEIDKWLDDNCEDKNMPNFIWHAVDALATYAESLER